MIDAIAGLIREEDVGWASQLMGLGAQGFAPIDGDDSRLKAMLNLDTADFEACPGSGKTTLLVAKLAVLASRWPYRQRGLCVLSHTNAARDEIGAKLCHSPAGLALQRYPHFIGTIHSFVNEYLALPWLRSKGNPIRVIDTQITLRKRMASLDWKWRNAIEKRGLNEYALVYDATDYTGDSTKGGLGRHTDTYKQMVAAARASSEQGYFCFDEMFVWARELLDSRPEVANDLRQRFPMVFIDEAQDNSELQSALLHKLFCEGGSPVRRQRFGDSNQAIYSRHGQQGAATDPFPSAPTYNIPRSYRFSQMLADEVKRLGVRPQELIGAGPTAARIETGAKSPAIFLFDDTTVETVLGHYGDYLIACFDESQLAKGTFFAVAGVHEMNEFDRIPRAMGHYWPRYNPSAARSEAEPASFAQYLAKAKRDLASTWNVHFLVNAVADALFELSERAGRPLRTFGRKSPHQRLLDALAGTPAQAEHQQLLDIVLQNTGTLSVAQWISQALPLVRSVAASLAGAKALPADTDAFLSWPVAQEVEADKPADAMGSENEYCHPHTFQPKVRVQLGSIHSVKGRTHTATLVLDSFFHKHHLSELKPWLLWERSGGSVIKKGKIVEEGARTLGRLKLHYVAMTRPSHLLCLAMRKDAFTESELDTLKGRGWQIIDCCRPNADDAVETTPLDEEI